jgi:uncharacterized repeat protein (TIGR01451 family)
MKKERKHGMRYFVFSLIMLMFGVSLAWSADQPHITVQLSAKKVIQKGQGQEVLSPGDTARPGEVIEYRVKYINTGKGAARNLQGGLPIPAEMEFVPGSAVPDDVTASLDGKSFEKIPLHRKVRLADGSIVVREVPPAEYRSLRWNFPVLEPGASITARARMRIKNDQNGPVVIKFDSKKK